jgi:hypothetical protein
MRILTADYKKELLQELEGLPLEKMKEVLDFVCFVKAKDAIDPSQSYFWTKKWQDMEKEAEEDKEKGRVIGDGTVKDLLKQLKK